MNKNLLFPILITIVSVCIDVSAQDSFQKNFQQAIHTETNYKNIVELMSATNVPGVSIAVIRDRKLYWAKGFGILQAGKKDKVDTDTLFSVGSISKVGTAIVTLRQVDLGKLALDNDINHYLTSWKIPENRYRKRSPVTLRHILSHTAGFNVHGFADFQPDETLPGTLDILKGKKPAKNDPIRLIYEPGTDYKYSGGGTTVVQMLLEDRLQQDFAQLAHTQLFKPLSMNRSTYQNPVPKGLGNIAKAHNRWGNPRALPRGYEAMPELAASGLWTTPSDLSKLITTLMKSYHNQDTRFISQKMTQEMMSQVKHSEFGLGPQLVGQYIFKHGGSNDSYKAFFQGNMQKGNGFVIFTNSANGNALIAKLRRVLSKLIEPG